MEQSDTFREKVNQRETKEKDGFRESISENEQSE